MSRTGAHRSHKHNRKLRSLRRDPRVERRELSSVGVITGRDAMRLDSAMADNESKKVPLADYKRAMDVYTRWGLPQ